jgi:hypothetical protein
MYTAGKGAPFSILGIVVYFTRSGAPRGSQSAGLVRMQSREPAYRDGQRKRKKLASNTSMPAGSSVISSLT